MDRNLILLAVRHSSSLPQIILFLFVILGITLVVRRFSGSTGKGKYSTRGVVKQYSASTELPGRTMKPGITRQVLRFWLERFDTAGNSLPNISVEIKGRIISGYIAEGDNVEFYDKILLGQIATPKIMYNHTANAYIKVEKA